MPRFTVTFLQDRIGPTPATSTARREREFTVLADDEKAALAEAERLYALAEGCDWRLRADAVEAQEGVGRAPPVA